MRHTLLALAALLALSQSAFALGETKGLGNIFGDVSGGTSGVTDAIAAGADKTCSRDSRPAIQDAVNAIVSRATAAQNTFYGGAVVLQSGCYKMGSTALTSATAGISIPPFVKIMSEGGPVELDWSSAPSGTIAFQINSGNWPFTSSSSALGQNAAGSNFAIDGTNGRIGVFGAAGDPNSVCVAIGNISDSVVVERDTKAGVRSLFCANWGESMLFRPYDTYLNKIEDFVSRNPYTAHWDFVADADGTDDNSGEGLDCDRCVFSGGQTGSSTPGVRLNTHARNITFHNGSFDYIHGALLHVPQQNGNGGYEAVDFANEHFENVDQIVTVSETQPFFLNLSFRDIYYVPGRTRSFDLTTANQWDRPIFKAEGAVKIKLDNWRVSLVSGTNSLIPGLWWMTSNTVDSGITNIDFQAQRNLIHESRAPNFNWNFVSSTAGTDMTWGAMPGWTVSNQGNNTLGLIVEASTSVPELGASLNRLKLTPSASTFVDLWTDAFPVTPGARMMAWPVIYGGDSSLNLSYTQQTIFYRNMFKQDVSVTSVTKSSNNLTINTVSPTGIESNTYVYILNSADPNYQNRPLPVFTISGNAVRVQVSSTWAMPIAVTGTTLMLRPEQLTAISATSTISTDVSSSIYGSTLDAAHWCGRASPDRHCWVQGNTYRDASRTNDWRIPQGATMARVKLGLTVSGTDPIYLGGLPSNMIP